MKQDKQKLLVKLSWFIGRMNERSVISEIGLSTGRSITREVRNPLRPFTAEEYANLDQLLRNVLDTCFEEEMKEAKQKQLDDLYQDDPNDYDSDWQFRNNQ